MMMKTTDKGMLIVLSAPSGCGKGTMIAEILRHPGFFLSVSATTRQPREGEKDGVDYYFTDREGFEELIRTGGVLEYASYCGNYYGTPLGKVEEKLGEGLNVLLEIEVEGAMKIKRQRPDALLIFVLPPSMAELRRRLEKRGTETEDVIDRRLAAAAREIEAARNYDYVIVNDDLERAVGDFIGIVNARRHSGAYASRLIDEVIKNDQTGGKSDNIER